MDKNIIDYLVKKIIEDIRKFNNIEPDLAESINKLPLIDSLRELVEEKDIQLLKDMFDKNIEVSKLSINLLKKFDKQPGIQLFLLDKWNMYTDFEHRMELMWRILDNDEIDIVIHKEIYNFVKDNEKKFLNNCSAWFGGEDQLLKACIDRLNNPSFARTKDWAYLYASIGSADKNGVMKLLSLYIDSENEFTKSVAYELISRIK